MTRLTIFAVLLAGPAFADQGPVYGHMTDWGYGHGIGMMFGPVLWLIVLGAVAAGIVWFVRRTDITTAQSDAASAQAELDLRLARGEIDAEDYSARKNLLKT